MKVDELKEEVEVSVEMMVVVVWEGPAGSG